MENSNKVTDNLAELIKSTIKSYLKATNNQEVRTQVVLDALMRVYNAVLLEVYIDAIQKEVTKKNNAQNGEQIKTDNK
jgi:hypothetical protein